jgi:hypothetical protein
MSKYFFILFIILIISCNPNNNNFNNSNAIAIDFNNSNEILYGKDIVEDINYIPLKIIDDKFLIESISSIFVTDSLLFIVDRFQKSLFVYDWNGNPLYKIGGVGQGPGEYIYLSEVIFDREKKRIIICDLFSRKILHYTFSGKLLKETKIPHEDLNYFAKDPKSDIIISERCDLRRDLLIAFDENENIINSHLKLSEKYMDHYIPYTSTIWESSPFYTFNDTVFYLSIFDYAIYSYADGKFNREYYLNIPENLKITSTNAAKNIDEYDSKRLLCKLTSLTVTDYFITFKAWGFGANNVLYNRKNKRSYFYGNLYCDGQGLYQDQILTEYNGWFVFLIYDPKGFEYLRKNLGMKIEEDDNPVLCFVKFKKEII